jgi:hypothetical protein
VANESYCLIQKNAAYPASLSLTRLRSVPPRPARPPPPLLTRAPAARPPHRDLDLALVVAGLATTRGGAGGRQRRNLLQLLRPSLRKGSVLFSSFLLFLVLATIAAAIASRHLQALSRVGIGGCAFIWSSTSGVREGEVIGDEEEQRCTPSCTCINRVSGLQILLCVVAGLLAC